MIVYEGNERRGKAGSEGSQRKKRRRKEDREGNGRENIVVVSIPGR